MAKINKDKIIVILALICILLAVIIMFDSYGRLTEAYEICLNQGSGILG